MILLLLAACTGAAAPDDSGPVVTGTCPDDTLASGATETVASGFASGTEGISFVDGTLYVAAPDGVLAVTPDGVATPLVTLDHALGLAPRPGGLYVADPGAFDFSGGDSDGSLLQVDVPGGAVTTLASGLPNPNFVLPLDDEVLVSDDTGETIYAVDPAGTTRAWLDGIPSPNGMAWSPDHDAIYAVTTFETEPPLWRIPVADGAPGAPEIVATFSTGDAPDGLAVDADGGVWVALNLAGALVRVDGDGTITDRVDGLTTPASLAFGSGAAWDSCSLYVTSLYGDTVTRVGTGRSGG